MNDLFAIILIPLLAVTNIFIISELQAIRKEIDELASWILPDHPDKPTDVPF